LPMYLSEVKRGMLGANNLVNSAILQLEQGSSTDFFENQISPVYQEAYVQDNIFTVL
jgi:hypothetical protein